MHNRITLLAAGMVAIVGNTASLATAQPVPDYDFAWSTIGSPGNRAANQQEAPWSWPRQIGAVGYEYRLTQTEVTVGQWVEFAQAYEPYYEGSRISGAFIGDWIVPTSLDPNEPAGFHAIAGTESYPANMSWRYAARFCNWLHNDKVTEQWAFESGAYDTSTFFEDENDFTQDQHTRSPSARFWIPSHDEWTKGMYFAPDRYGSGQEGYWIHPDAGDDPLVPGEPGIGETSAGMFAHPPVPVAAYPLVQSPWGLLDGSGGEGEWTETIGSIDGSRVVRGSFTGSDAAFYWIDDRIDGYSISGTRNFSSGLRIASIPAPGSFTLGVVMLVVANRRRERWSRCCGLP